ncbi:MAG: sel1 repeat family protein, partial [Alphaproteobacteria bacterium]
AGHGVDPGLHVRVVEVRPVGEGLEEAAHAACGDLVLVEPVGSTAGCANLGASYSLGRGVGRNHRRAAQLLGQACDADDQHACYNLGVLYRDGLGVKRNAERAVALFKQSCEAQEPSACGNLGNMVDDGKGARADCAIPCRFC